MLKPPGALSHVGCSLFVPWLLRQAESNTFTKKFQHICRKGTTGLLAIYCSWIKDTLSCIMWVVLTICKSLLHNYNLASISHPFLVHCSRTLELRTVVHIGHVASPLFSKGFKWGELCMALNSNFAKMRSTSFQAV